MVTQGKPWDHWLSPPRFAIALALLIVTAFPDVLLWGRVFVFRDFGAFGLPLAHYYREMVGRGEIPLWNPLNNMGLPFLAQWNTMVLYPPCLLYLVLPWPWGVSVLCLMHLFLGGMGMYLLAERWTACRLGAAVGGVAYAFSGLMLNCLMWPNNVAALAWMPWVVLYAELAWRGGGRVWITAGLLGALQMLSGAPEIILFTWAVVALVWIVHWGLGEADRWRTALRFFSLAAVIVGLTAAQLLPFFEMLRSSQRDARYGTSDWAMPAWGWANLFVPLFRCHRSAQGVFLQADQVWTSSYYVGIGILALAVLGIFSQRHWRVWLLTVIAGFGLLLAMGDHGWVEPCLRRMLPEVGFMRFPIKYVVLVTFAVPLLAAYGVRACSHCEPERRHRLWRAGGIVSVGFLAIIFGITWYASESPHFREDSLITWRNGLERAVWLLLALGAGCGVSNSGQPRWRMVIMLLLVTFVWLDATRHVPSQNPTVGHAAFASQLPGLREWQHRPEAGVSRAMPSLRSILEFSHRMNPDPGTGFLCDRAQLLGNTSLLEDVAYVGGFYSLYFRTERDIQSRLFRSTNEIRAPLADFLGVSHITDDRHPLQWLPRQTWLPLVSAGQKPICGDAATVLAGMTSADFAPHRVVYLPEESRQAILVTNQTDALILSQRFTAHEVSARVRASQPSLVVLAQNFHRPWKAYVDDQSVPLWRANHSFQAVQVPAGWHDVRVRYEDSAFRRGAVISLFTLTGCLGAWLWLGRGHRAAEGNHERAKASKG